MPEPWSGPRATWRTFVRTDGFTDETRARRREPRRLRRTRRALSLWCPNARLPALVSDHATGRRSQLETVGRADERPAPVPHAAPSRRAFACSSGPPAAALDGPSRSDWRRPCVVGAVEGRPSGFRCQQVLLGVVEAECPGDCFAGGASCEWDAEEVAAVAAVGFGGGVHDLDRDVGLTVDPDGVTVMGLLSTLRLP
jgi:hypothetical protein